jgi:hypothetical protein
MRQLPLLAVPVSGAVTLIVLGGSNPPLLPVRLVQDRLNRFLWSRSRRVAAK